MERFRGMGRDMSDKDMTRRKKMGGNKRLIIEEDNNKEKY